MGNWLDADRDALRLHRQLTVAAGLWIAGDRDPGELYRGGRLEGAERWALQHREALNESETEFLSESLQQAEATADAEQRGARRIRRALVAVAVVAVVAMVAGALAWQQQRRADATAFAAETSRLAASAPNVAQRNPAAGWLVAAESYRRDPGPETLGALQQAMVASDAVVGFMGNGQAYVAVTISDGRVFGRRNQGLDCWDVRTGERFGSVEMPADEFAPARLPPSRIFDQVSVSVAGDTAAVDFTDGTVALVDLVSGSVRPVDVGPARLAALSPDGDHLAVLHVDSGITMIEPATGAERWIENGNGDVFIADQTDPLGLVPRVNRSSPLPSGLLFGPDGDLFVSSNGLLRRFDVASGDLLATTLTFSEADGAEARAVHLGFSADGSELLGAGFEGTMTLDAQSLDKIGEARLVDVSELTFLVRSAVAIGDRRMLTVSARGQIVEIDSVTGEWIGDPLDSHVGSIRHLAVDRETGLVAGAGTEGVALLDPARIGPLAVATALPPGHSTAVLAGDILISQRGSKSGVQSVPPVVRRCPGWSSCTTIDGALGGAEGLLEADSSGDLLWRIVGTGSAFYDPVTMTAMGSIPGRFASTGAAVDPDLDWVALAVGTRIDVFEPVTGQSIAAIHQPAGVSPSEYHGLAEELQLSVSADGSRLLATVIASGDSFLIDTVTWEPAELFPVPSGQASAAMFSADGRYLTTVDLDGVITVRDATTFAPISQGFGELANRRCAFAGGSRCLPFATASNLQQMAFSDDGRHLVTVLDESAQIWMVETGEPVGEPYPNDVGFIPASLSARCLWLSRLSETTS